MLEISIERKIYPNGYQALQAMSLTFPDRGLFAIVGESGSGKSTLLSCIGGLDDFDGTLRYNGESVRGKKQTDAYRRQVVATVFQDFRLVSGLNVADNIRLAGEIVGKRMTDDQVYAVLQAVGMDATQADKSVDELSYGQMQRVAIARAAAKGAPILLADEPTANLDSDNARNIIQIFRELANTHLVLVVTHNRALADAFCDGQVELEDGTVIADTLPRVEPGSQIPTNVTPKSRARMSCLHKLVRAQGKQRLKALALSILTVVFLLLSATGVVLYDLQETDAAARTLDASGDDNPAIYAQITYRQGEETRSALPADRLGNYAAYDQVGGSWVSAAEYGKYTDVLMQMPFVFPETPQVAQVIYTYDAADVGMRMLAGKSALGQGEIILPSYLADVVLAIGSTQYCTVSEGASTYADVLGSTVTGIPLGNMPADTVWIVVGVYQSPTGGAYTPAEYRQMNDVQKQAYASRIQAYSQTERSTVLVGRDAIGEWVDGVVIPYTQGDRSAFEQAQELAQSLGSTQVRYAFAGSNGLHDAVRGIQSVQNVLILPLCLLMAAVSALCSYIAMSTSIARSRESILTLRALGASRTDVYRIFAIAALAVSVLQVIIACLLLCAVVPMLNSVARSLSKAQFVLFGIDLPALVIPLGIAVGVNLITAFGAVFRLFSRSVQRRMREV